MLRRKFYGRSIRRLCTGYRKNDEPIREPIARLGKMISDRMEVMLGKEKITKESPEYWGLAPICTDEQALIAIKMGKKT